MVRPRLWRSTYILRTLTSLFMPTASRGRRSFLALVAVPSCGRRATFDVHLRMMLSTLEKRQPASHPNQVSQPCIWFATCSSWQPRVKKKKKKSRPRTSTQSPVVSSCLYRATMRARSQQHGPQFERLRRNPSSEVKPPLRISASLLHHRPLPVTVSEVECPSMQMSGRVCPKSELLSASME